VKVLLVDDSDFTRRILAKIFRELEIFLIDEAVNGLEAIKKLEQTKYDLVTVDLIMPNSSGIDVINHIKKLHPKTSVIVCSSVNVKETVMELVKIGIDDFILKPFNEAKAKDVLAKKIAFLQSQNTTQ
jgi:two-component system chemotaxis response regulator CheY